MDFLPGYLTGKPYLLQNSLLAESIENWLNSLDDKLSASPHQTLDIDYNRYGRGEALMAWLDEKVELKTHQGDASAAVVKMIKTFLEKLKSRGAAIGHLKFIINSKWQNL